MVKTFETPEINNITRNQLLLGSNDLSGDLIDGGTITNFSSTGIKDCATRTSLIVEDDKILVKNLMVKTIESDFTVRGDVKIYGTLDVGQLRAVEVTTNSKHQRQFLEFSNPHGSIGTGLLWSDKHQNKQFVYKIEPERFWSTENIDIPGNKSYQINGQDTLSLDSLGTTVTNSSLQKLGTLKNLTVAGKVNLGDVVFFNPKSERFSIGTEDANGKLTIYDYVNDVELTLSSNSLGNGVIGTYNTKGLDFVTDNQTRLTINVNGDITLGLEQKDSTVTRIYGKVGVGIKNPTEQLEIAGNIRWSNRLFTTGNQPPVTGNYSLGDIVWNSNPKESAYVGWVCIVGGAPGKWRPFAQIL